MKNNANEMRKNVRSTYAQVVKSNTGGCGCSSDASCCGEAVNTLSSIQNQAEKIGYTKDEIKNVPKGANMDLGCGNPHLLAHIKQGDTVLDLGSGGGVDCFIAAKKVGKKGQVIGIDMTSEMITKARAIAQKEKYFNVEFRLGEIEHLPVADNSIDSIISNCVINLSPEKEKVFQEAYRVLKKGGRLAITDIITTIPLPNEIKENPELQASCVGGAVTKEELENTLKKVGFRKINIKPIDKSKEIITEDYIFSGSIEAVK
ncbi:arsenite methyltransferase [Candidatus Margulisiibacteriota bacterium]